MTDDRTVELLRAERIRTIDAILRHLERLRDTISDEIDDLRKESAQHVLLQLRATAKQPKEEGA